MKVFDDDMHPELRRLGCIIRTVLPYWKEGSAKVSARASSMLRFKVPLSIKKKVVHLPTGLRLVIYRSKKPLDGKRPGLLWIHGGGYAVGAPEQDIGYIKKFIKRFGMTVVSPDYTLSVDAPYPKAIEECYEALLYLKNNADSLNVDVSKIVVGGNSAGGGLAAALAILARDRAEVDVKLQLPLFPMLDDRMTTKSMIDNDGPIWNEKSNRLAWRLYLGSLFGSESVPEYASPARLESYEGLPPAIAYVGSIDPFRDETIEYFEKLKGAGIETSLMIVDGAYHGFDIIKPNSTPAKNAHAFMLEEMAKYL